MSENSERYVVHRCPKCISEEGYYQSYGRLVWVGDDPGNCPHHKNTPLMPIQPTERDTK